MIANESRCHRKMFPFTKSILCFCYASDSSQIECCLGKCEENRYHFPIDVRKQTKASAPKVMFQRKDKIWQKDPFRLFLLKVSGENAHTLIENERVIYWSPRIESVIIFFVTRSFQIIFTNLFEGKKTRKNEEKKNKSVNREGN